MYNDKLQEIEVLIRARYPIISIISFEEDRVVNEIKKIAKKLDKKIFTWSAYRGLHAPDESIQSKKRTFPPSTQDPLESLNEVISFVEPAIFIFEDFHPYLKDIAIVRALRELALYLKSSYKTMILISPTLQIPLELEKDITVVDFCLPSLNDLSTLLDQILKQLAEDSRLKVVVDDQTREKLLKAALGLTLKEAENTFARALVISGKLTEDEIDIVLQEKEQAIRKSGILEYYHTDESLNNIGGLENLKQWFNKRSLAFSEKARAYGLPPPKGILLIGVQGCGKSLCAKAISRQWSLPLLRFDVGKVFASHVGSSEENIRRAIVTAESVSPCILWIDEIEKAFAGTRSSHLSDAGVTSRVFGSFITWLQEKQSSVFVVATANNIQILPPELLRKGRFDEIFFVDLPDDEERKEIFRIHIKKRGRDPGNFDIDRLVEASVGFSGSEIEQAIISSMYDAFYEGKEINTEYIVKSIQATVPLSRTMDKEIGELRTWAETRAVSASVRDGG
ncbi:MAG: AAA family ATPase [Chloroflexi bacterium]|nr:AAA family ATPase [Chloroflexota bacterium]